MEPSPSPSAAVALRRPVAAYIAIVGALIAFVGVFLEWVKITEVRMRGVDAYVSLVSAMGGPRLSPQGLADQSMDWFRDMAQNPNLAYAGRTDWTGFLVGLAAVVVLLAAAVALLFATRDVRRLGGLATVIAGGIILGLCLVAFLGAERIAGHGLSAGVARDIEAEVGSIPFMGGFIIHRAARAILDFYDIGAHASYGLYVTAGGGLIALVAGALLMQAPAPVVHGHRVHGALARTVAALDPADRRSLFEILTAPVEQRGELARAFYETPDKESWREVIGELERDERSRKDVVEAIRKIDEG